MHYRWVGLGGIVLAIGCAGSRPCASLYAPGTPRGTFLWDVRGPHGSFVLLGTHHAASADDIPPAAMQALETAQVYVAEAPEGGPDDTFESSRQLREALSLPAGESLRRMLGGHDFDVLEGHVQPDRDTVDRMRPWVALSLLVKGVFELPEPNMAASLVHEARDHGLAMEFLESWAIQANFLDMVVGVSDLQGAIHDYGNLACGVQREVDAYRIGDANRFIRAELASTEGPEPSHLVKATGIEVRNHVWADKLAAYANSGRRVFVAIGVSNILGPSGVGKLLTDAGFTVTRR